MKEFAILFAQVIGYLIMIVLGIWGASELIWSVDAFFDNDWGLVFSRVAAAAVLFTVTAWIHRRVCK